MIRKVISILLVVLMLVMTTIPSATDAGWVDDWITQKTSVGPTSLEGQKRGYFTAGSFSARWPTNSDKLFSITPPRLKFGCGGIDLFLGGFSFLNFEYLVQKLQRILAAAPAAAFDIALNTLCTECAKAIKSMESIADKLNSMQMDDCQMGRALAVEMLYPLDPKKLAGDKAVADKQLNIFSGVIDLFQSGTDKQKAAGDKPMSPEPETIAGCPAEIKAIMQTGSVLDNINSQLGNKYSSSMIALARGYIGDIDVELVDNQYVPHPIASCGEASPQSVDDFLTGKVYQRNGDACTQIPDAKANIYNYVDSRIRSVYNSLKNKSGGLSQDDEKFLTSLPFPALNAMKAAIATRMDDVAIVALSDLAARAYAAMIMSDLYNNVSNIIYRAEEMVHKKGAYNMKDCQLGVVKNVVDAIETLRTPAREFTRAVYDNYIGSANAMNAVIALSQRYEEWNNLITGELSKRFSLVNLSKVK
ncbi:MAG: conjugal transfer protein TraH [Candidatus Methanomethylicaceae archaeon]